MFNLGLMYEKRRGVSQDAPEVDRLEATRECYEAAAEAGVTKAMVNLGVLYLSGRLPGHQPEEALEWFKKAGDAGDLSGKSAPWRSLSSSCPPSPSDVYPRNFKRRFFCPPSLMTLRIRVERASRTPIIIEVMLSFLGFKAPAWFAALCGSGGIIYPWDSCVHRLYTHPRLSEEVHVSLRPRVLEPP